MVAKNADLAGTLAIHLSLLGFDWLQIIGLLFGLVRDNMVLRESRGGFE